MATNTMNFQQILRAEGAGLVLTNATPEVVESLKPHLEASAEPKAMELYEKLKANAEASRALSALIIELAAKYDAKLY
jgi:hypothetical protein